MRATEIEQMKTTFNGVGWFIPPYVSMGFLRMLAKKITDAKQSFSQSDLEKVLALIYSPENLAAMVLHRYPITPFVNDYKIIISEAVSAHFSGLDHVAASGLIPVIEGAGKAIARSRSLNCENVSIRKILMNLAENCRIDSQKNNIGLVSDVVSMMNSFSEYADKHLYIDSSEYPHEDKTNRHGILHGAYSDDDYGSPINFYKAITAVDFLCFISAFRAAISWMAPDPTDESDKLGAYYRTCQLFHSMNPEKQVK